MGRIFDGIDAAMTKFLESSPVYFVATAPSGDEGHINLSPKGLDSFRVLDLNNVAYLDLNGSGAETIAHLRQNGRICFMFMAFSGKPKIIRLYGRAKAVFPEDMGFEDLVSKFGNLPGIRSVVQTELDRISDSCGFGVPLMDYVGPRDEITNWAEKMGEAGLAKYRRDKNQQSIDGLPAIDSRD